MTLAIIGGGILLGVLLGAVCAFGWKITTTLMEIHYEVGKAATLLDVMRQAEIRKDYEVRR